MSNCGPGVSAFWVLSQGAVEGVVGAFSKRIVCHTFQFPPNMLSRPRLCASAFFLHFVSSHFHWVRLQIQVPDSIIQYILSLALHMNFTVFLCSQSMFWKDANLVPENKVDSGYIAVM